MWLCNDLCPGACPVPLIRWLSSFIMSLIRESLIQLAQSWIVQSCVAFGVALPQNEGYRNKADRYRKYKDTKTSTDNEIMIFLTY